MKKSLFLLVALSFVLIPAKAAVTVEQTSDAELMINAGYSQSMAEDVFVQKNRIAGKPIEPLYEKSQNKFVKVCKKIYAYLDPGVENYDHIHHDISRSPSMLDL